MSRLVVIKYTDFFFAGKWLVPPKPSPNKSWCQMFSEKLPHHFTISYWKNNRPFLCFLYFIIGVNIVAMVQRAYYFKDFSMLNGYTPNVFYMVSRACGKFWYSKLDCSVVSSQTGLLAPETFKDVKSKPPSKPFLSCLKYVTMSRNSQKWSIILMLLRQIL